MGSRSTALIAGMWKSGPGPRRYHAQNCRGRTGDRNRNQASRPQLEQQKFYREQDCRDGRREGSRHTRCGSSHQKRSAFRIGELDPLCDERAKRTAAHDDGALCPERTAGTNSNRCRDGFQDGDLRVDPRAVQQDGLDRFGNTMPPDLVRPEASHPSNQQSANYRHNNHPITQRAARRGDRG